MEKKYGFVRVGAVVPEIRISNVAFNVEEIKKYMDEAYKKGVEITVFPELSITGYTCADLFQNELLLDQAEKALIELKKYTEKLKGVFIVGLPIRCNNQLFNIAAVLEGGHILGMVPKTYIPNYGEFYEKRWFSEAKNLNVDTLTIDGEIIPFKTNLLFREGNDLKRTFGIEICEDLWCPYPPSIDAAVNGATMLFNLSASNEIIGKYEYRKSLVKGVAEKTVSAYVYASSGANESSTDLVFSGHSLIVENGRVLSENERFDLNGNMIINDVDVNRLSALRYKDISYMAVLKNQNKDYEVVEYKGYDPDNDLIRIYDEYPFVPKNEQERAKRSEEILTIQAVGLAKRLKT
ncbi:MAG: NAD(+) synthase, partial [Bacilli bacterium]|nr:NAD(+) synthase [Bacilli bacterium]